MNVINLRNDGTGRKGGPLLAAVREDFKEHFSISARSYCLRYIFVGYAERAMFPIKCKKHFTTTEGKHRIGV